MKINTFKSLLCLGLVALLSGCACKEMCKNYTNKHSQRVRAGKQDVKKKSENSKTRKSCIIKTKPYQKKKHANLNKAEPLKELATVVI